MGIINFIKDIFYGNDTTDFYYSNVGAIERIRVFRTLKEEPSYPKLFSEKNISVKVSFSHSSVIVFISQVKVLELFSYSASDIGFVYKFSDKEVFDDVWVTLLEIGEKIEKIKSEKHLDDIQKVKSALNKNKG
jgi:hypothetical protein